MLEGWADDGRANEGTVPVQAVLTRTKKALNEANRTIGPPEASNVDCFPMTILIGFAVRDQNFHMQLSHELDGLPLDGDQVVEAKEGGVAEGDGGKFHELIEISRRIHPQLKTTANLGCEKRAFLVQTSDLDPTSSLPCHADKRMVCRRGEAGQGVVEINRPRECDEG
jgi:hypothetical protein